jgi:hypothetical protein
MRKMMLLVAACLFAAALPASAAAVRVKAAQTPLRAEPVATSVIVTRLDQGAVLDLVDVVRDWYRVRDPRTGKEGFVLASLVELLPGGAAGAAAQGAPRVPAVPKPGAPAKAPAPPPKPGEWRDSGFVALSGLYQGAPGTFGYSFSPPEYAYAETAHLTTHYGMAAGAGFDGAFGWRVHSNLAVGAAVSVFSKAAPVSVDGTVPHPLYLNRDRSVTGSFSSLRNEVGIHLQATWVVPSGRRMLIALSGGPSYISVSQDVASGINLSTVYPYDSTDVAGATTTRASKGQIGFNAGADVAYFFSGTVGVGVMARFSRASVSLPTPGGNVNSAAGGFQAGVGLRFRIGSPAAKPPARGPAKAPPGVLPVRK